MRPILAWACVVFAAIAAIAAQPRTCEAQFDLRLKLDLSSPSRLAGIAVADFNRDGHLDVAAADVDSNRVRIRMGDGTGGFAPPTALAADAGLKGISVGDFDHDGWPDLVVTNTTAGTLSVFMGSSFGFASRADYGTAVNPVSVVTEDLNADGSSDVVVVNSTSNSLWVRMGGGTGILSAANVYPTGATPYAVTTCDLNSDGAPDLVAANMNAGTVSVLLGTGSGSFGLKTDFSTGGLANSPVFVAAGDLNGDAKPDLAVANRGPDTVGILLGDGLGGFGTATQYSVGAGTDPSSLVIADITGDGIPDVTVARENATAFSILPGNGSGGFGAKSDFILGAPSLGLAICDMNQDGNRDIVTTVFPNKLSVLLGHGSGDFGSKLDFPVAGSTGGIAMADLTGEGDLDVVVASYLSDSISVLLGDGSGSFSPRTDFPCGDTPTVIAIGKLNGDAAPDLAVVNAAEGLNQFSVLLGNGSGGFGAPTPFNTGQGPRTLAMGDLTGEGNLDLVVDNQLTNSVSIHLGDGAGGFTFGGGYVTGVNTAAIALGKVDADGDVDIVTWNGGGNPGAGHVAFLAGNGLGGFDPPASTPIVGTGRDVTLGHIDSDGDLDILVTVAATGVVLLGNGSGGFGSRTNWTMANGVAEAEIADFNGDGRVDLGAASGAGFSLVLGDGSGGFGPHHEYPGGIDSRGLATGDLDGNGRADAVMANAGSSSISVLLGRGKTHTQLVADPTRCELGGNLILAATVGSLAPGGHVPTGSVRFFDGLTPLGSATVANGVATLQISAQFNSTRKLTAEYRGDRRHYGSFSEPFAVEVFLSSVDVPSEVSEARFALDPVRPNPVSGNAGTVRFELPISSPVRLGVFDVHGRRILERDLGDLGAGPHTVKLPGLDSMAPGLYFVRLVQGDRTAVSRFTLLRVPPG